MRDDVWTFQESYNKCVGLVLCTFGTATWDRFRARTMFSKRAVLSQFRPPVTSLGLHYVRRSFKASSGTLLCFHLQGVEMVYI